MTTGKSSAGRSRDGLRPPPELRTRSEGTRPVREGTLVKRISMEISRQCNLRCVYCYAESSPERNGGLTDEEVRDVIREAVEIGACQISFVSPRLTKT